VWQGSVPRAWVHAPGMRPGILTLNLTSEGVGVVWLDALASNGFEWGVALMVLVSCGSVRSRERGSSSLVRIPKPQTRISPLHRGSAGRDSTPEPSLVPCGNMLLPLMVWVQCGTQTRVAPFGACEVRCWHWLFGNKKTVSAVWLAFGCRVPLMVWVPCGRVRSCERGFMLQACGLGSSHWI